MPTRSGNFQRAAGLRLAAYIRKIGAKPLPGGIVSCAAGGAELCLPRQAADHIRSAAGGVNCQLLGHGGFGGVFGRNKQLGHARLLGGKGHGQGTGNGAQCAIQPKLTQKCLVRLWLWDVLLRRQNADEHRQVIQTAGLAHIGGSQVDGNMAGGPGAVQVFDGAAHPLTAFLHGGIRQAHHGKFGQTAADVGFHGNGVAIQPRYPQADNVCIHGAANSFFNKLRTLIIFSISCSARGGKHIFCAQNLP